MTARQGLLPASLALALALISPSPARATWVECESDAPGRLTVGVILNPDQEAIDPAVATLIWRTVGPTEKVFYRGPLLNFGATIEGLAAGRYSIAYEYRGPEGDDTGSFCSIEVAGTSAAPAISPRPTATADPGATPAPAPTRSASPEVVTVAPPDTPPPSSAATDPTSGRDPLLTHRTDAGGAASGSTNPTPAGLVLVGAGLLLALLALQRGVDRR
jgi:hypothetical protein